MQRRPGVPTTYWDRRRNRPYPSAVWRVSGAALIAPSRRERWFRSGHRCPVSGPEWFGEGRASFARLPAAGRRFSVGAFVLVFEFGFVGADPPFGRAVFWFRRRSAALIAPCRRERWLSRGRLCPAYHSGDARCSRGRASLLNLLLYRPNH